MDLTNQKGKAVTALGAAALLSGADLAAQNTDPLTLPPAPIKRIESERRSPPEFFRKSDAAFPEHWAKPEAAASPAPSGRIVPIVTPPPANTDDLGRKSFISGVSALLALGGYALSIHRGTPKEQRQNSLITRACESLFPETPFFPNNKASWLMSTLNSSSLFLLGVLGAVQSGQSLVSSALSMAVVGIYAAGAGWLCANGFKYGGEFKMHPTDKKCLIGGCIGLGTFIYCGLSRMGIVPAVDAPLEIIGMAVGLFTRGMAISPLFREFRSCVKTARANAEAAPGSEVNERALPSLGSHVFWNAAIMLNLANLASFSTKAAIVPIGMTIQNWILIGTAAWAYRQVHNLSKTAEK